MMDMDHDELSRLIDLKIAASLERIGQRLDDYAWMVVQEEIEWLRMP